MQFAHCSLSGIDLCEPRAVKYKYVHTLKCKESCKADLNVIGETNIPLLKFYRFCMFKKCTRKNMENSYHTDIIRAI